MPTKKNWFSLQWQTYTELSKSELEKIFSTKRVLSSSFKVFLEQAYPDFLKDFLQYEKKIEES